MKKRYTGLNDKRHYCGKLAPNIFFFFEIVAILESAYVAVHVLAYMGIKPNALEMIIVVFFSLLALGKFWQDRRRVLNRQKGRCPDPDSPSKEPPLI